MRARFGGCGAVTAKAFLTLLFWLLILGAVGDAMDGLEVAPLFAGSNDVTAALGVFAALTAVFGAALIWGLPEFIRLYNSRLDAASGAEKAKHSGASQRAERLAWLLDSLDEEEFAAVRATLARRLLDEEGDSPDTQTTLAALLAETESMPRQRATPKR